MFLTCCCICLGIMKDCRKSSSHALVVHISRHNYCYQFWWILPLGFWAFSASIYSCRFVNFQFLYGCICLLIHHLRSNGVIRSQSYISWFSSSFTLWKSLNSPSSLLCSSSTYSFHQFLTWSVFHRILPCLSLIFTPSPFPGYLFHLFAHLVFPFDVS